MLKFVFLLLVFYALMILALYAVYQCHGLAQQSDPPLLRHPC